MESVEHVRDYEAFCSVICGSIKVGGRLYISAPSEERMPLAPLNYIWHYHHFMPGELGGMIGGFGMRKVRGMSSNACLMKDGVFLHTYPHPLHGQELLEENVGDTHFYVFERVV